MGMRVNAPLIAAIKSLQKDISQTKWFFSTAIVIAGAGIAITNAVN